MRAGRLRHSVRLERRVALDDQAGNEQTGGWAPIATVAGELKPMRGAEALVAGRLEGRVAYEVLIRWTPALAEGAARLTTADRAVNARTGDVFDIRAVEDREERRRWLTITCEWTATS